MADTKTLSLKFKTDGADQAIRKMTIMGNQAQKTGKATDLLGQKAKLTGTALVDKLGKGVSKVAGFLSGKGNSAVSKFLGSMGNLVTSIGGVKAAMIAMIAIGIVKFLNDASKAAAQFNKELSNIATLMPENEERVRALGTGIQEMSVVVGKSMNDLSDATYQVISAFPELEDNAQILSTLGIAARASAAGMATTQDAVNLLSAVTKGYGDTSAEALQKVSDLAFTTVKLGQTTFPELAASMGKAVPLASALGISMEELFAAEATLTGVTGGASEVTTQLASIMSSLLKPTADMQKLMTQIGAQTGEEFIDKAGGMGAAIQLISDTAEASGKPLGDFLGRKEAIVATLALAGAQAENYIMKLDEMYKATGATATAFNEVVNGVNEYGFAIEQTGFAMDNLKVNIGQMVLPIKALIAEAIRPVIEYLSNLFRMFGNIISVIVRVGKAVLSLTPGFQILRLAVKGINETVKRSADFWEKVDVYVKLLIASFRERLLPVLTTVKDFFIKLLKPVTDLFTRIKEGLPKITALEAALFTVEVVLASLGTLFDIVKFAVLTLWDSFKGVVDIVAVLLEPAIDKLKETFQKLLTPVSDFFNKAKEGANDLGIMEAITWALQKAFGAVGIAIEMIVMAISVMLESFGRLVTAAKELGPLLKSIFTGRWDEVGDRAASIKEAFTGLGSDIRDNWDNMIVSIGDRWGNLGDRVAAQVQEIQGLVNDSGNMTPDVGGGGGLDSLSAYEQALLTMAEGLSSIDRNAEALSALGMEYDAAGESASLYSTVLSQLLSNTDSTGAEITSFIDLFNKLALAEEAVAATTDALSTSFDPYQVQMNEGIDTILRNVEAYKLLGTEYDHVAAGQELYNSVMEEMIANGDVSIEQLAKMAEQWGWLGDEVKGVGDEITTVEGHILKFVEKMVTAFGYMGEEALALVSALAEIAGGLYNLAQQQFLQFFDSMGSALEDGKISGKEFGQIMADMGRAILQQLPLLFLQAGLQLIATPGMWALGLGFIAAAGSTALIGGYVNAKSENANGNAFSNGNIVPFANGGAFTNSIVSSPTLFPMANGAGLMGEAGPEAVMPLTRGADGKLGVSAQGGAGVKVIINNYSGEQVTTEESENGAGEKEINVMIGQAVRSGFNNGEYDSTMKNRYNMKVAGY